MIVKRNFNPIRVINYVKAELLLAAAASLCIWWLHTQNISTLSLPFSVAAILGSALAIFIAFRNNSSYGRWWEARTQWGSIVNSCRVLARLIITFTDSHAHQQNYDANRGAAFKKNMVHYIIAWVHALRIQLRSQNSWQEIAPFLTEDEYKQLSSAHNKPNYLQLIAGQKIYEAMANGTLGGFDSFQLEGQLLALTNFQGNCERIKDTPLLRQYDYFTRVFMYVFIVLLPLSLIGDFAKLNIDYLTLPVSLIISFVFAIIGKVGQVNEDPFENKITDVPLTALCNTIERDLKEMLGQESLPAKAVPNNGFLM